MNEPSATPRLSGRAFRVTLLISEPAEAYRDVRVQIDGQAGLVHVFSADGRTHYLSMPASSTLVEWEDPAALQPQIRVPPLGAGAFDQMGEQMQRMIQGMQHGMGMG